MWNELKRLLPCMTQLYTDSFQMGNVTGTRDNEEVGRISTEGVKQTYLDEIDLSIPDHVGRAATERNRTGLFLCLSQVLLERTRPALEVINRQSEGQTTKPSPRHPMADSILHSTLRIGDFWST